MCLYYAQNVVTDGYSRIVGMDKKEIHLKPVRALNASKASKIEKNFIACFYIQKRNWALLLI